MNIDNASYGKGLRDGIIMSHESEIKFIEEQIEFLKAALEK
ncbi:MULTISPECIES: hypothetical protein [Bacillus cereus group]|nr:hypothetical protein [Bacillus cereus group sp. BfR-BA-01522]